MVFNGQNRERVTILFFKLDLCKSSLIEECFLTLVFLSHDNL